MIIVEISDTILIGTEILYRQDDIIGIVSQYLKSLPPQSPKINHSRRCGK